MESVLVIAEEVPKVVENVVNDITEITIVAKDIIQEVEVVTEKVEKLNCFCFKIKGNNK